MCIRMLRKTCPVLKRCAYETAESVLLRNLCDLALLKNLLIGMAEFHRIATGAQAWLHAATREDMTNFKFTLARTASSKVSSVRMAR